MQKGLTKKVLQFFWKLRKPYRFAFTGMFFCSLISLGFELTPPFFYKQIIDSLGANDIHSALLALLYLLGVSLGHHTFWNLGHFLLVAFETRMMRDTEIKAFRHVEKLSYSFHTAHFAGSTVKKCTRGVHGIESLIDRVWFDLGPVVLQFIAVTVIFGLKAPNLMWALLTGTILFFGLTIYLNNKQAVLAEASNLADTRNSGNFHDVVSNIFTVKIFAREKDESKRHLNFLEDWLKKTQKAWWYYNRISIVQATVTISLELALMYLSISYFSAGRFTIGDIVFVQTYFMTLIGNIWRLGWVYRDFRRAIIDTSELIELLETPPLIVSHAEATELKVNKGEVEFKKVNFNYGDGQDAVLKDLSLSIKSGEKIALVGPSGSGKSTFVKLLMRLVDASSGQILIDGQEIKSVTVESLRQAIGLVPQDPVLFHRPLHENIAYSRPGATLDEIKQASHLAHADEFIERTRQGYETQVGERGVKLSGGERQRVAIARAILEDAPIIVFDEATSSLDSISEKHIQSALENLMRGRTTIVVAHRLSTISHMDRILVFSEGRIVEEGSHAELTKKPDSLYKQLWDIQAGGFLKE